jgi:hypothetical protein
LSHTLDSCEGEYKPPQSVTNKSTTPPNEVLRTILPPFPMRTIENDAKIRPPVWNEDDNDDDADHELRASNNDVADLYAKVFEEALSKRRIYLVTSGLSDEEGEVVVRLCATKLKRRGKYE